MSQLLLNVHRRALVVYFHSILGSGKPQCRQSHRIENTTGTNTVGANNQKMNDSNGWDREIRK